jgi:hypothetical protein
MKGSENRIEPQISSAIQEAIDEGFLHSFFATNSGLGYYQKPTDLSGSGLNGFA